MLLVLIVTCFHISLLQLVKCVSCDVLYVDNDMLSSYVLIVMSLVMFFMLIITCCHLMC